MSIDVLYGEVEQARQSWYDLVALLSSGRLDFERARVTLGDRSMSGFARQMDLCFELLAGVRPTEETSPASAVLHAQEANLRPQLQAIFTHAAGAVGQLRANWRDRTQLADLNEGFTLQLLEDGAAIASIDLSGYFKNIRIAGNTLIQLLGAIVPLCKADQVVDLGERAGQLAKTVRQVDELRLQAEKSANIAKSFEHKSEKTEAAGRELLAAVETILANLRELQQQATTDSSSVTTLVEQIKTVGAIASNLDAMVDTYKGKFEAFQVELEARNTSFVNFEEQTRQAKEKSVARENEIDRLVTLADAMISGSTTAGLAKSLEETRKRYEARMNTARLGFVVAVILLAVTAAPLAAHLLPGLFGGYFPAATDAAHNTWYGVLGKVLLMVPATWLTGFFTKSYADSSHLEREYAHKAALAMSVDGFKRQAPKYEEEITAEVFLEIRNNPAKGTSVEPAAHPLYDVLAKVVGKVLQKGKGGE